jgi:hydroxyacylglutathione hydrolase
MSENTMEKLSNEKFAELKNSHYVIDTRQPEVFAACHVKDSINIPAGGSFCGWAGMVVPADEPLIIILENENVWLETIEQLSVVGLLNVTGFIVWNRNIHKEMDSLELLTPRQLSQTPDVFIIDVRTASEWNHGHISTANHMELLKFKDLITQIPQNKKIAITCGSGFRASIAASLLQKNGFEDVANVQGGMQAWKQANLPVITGTL